MPAVEGGAAAVRPVVGSEIKHDGYRLMVHRDGSCIRCFTRNGHDWGDRFPGIVLAARRLKAKSFVIDGEVVVLREDGQSDFEAFEVSVATMPPCCSPSIRSSAMAKTCATCR